MSRRPLAPGDLLLARLPQLAPPGREQSATPPVLVVALPSRPGAQRYPMIVAAPLTTQLSEWVTAAPDLYPTLNAGMGGLVKDSAVMLEHLRGIDAGHIVKPLGALSAKAYAPISASLEVMFGFRGSAA